MSETQKKASPEIEAKIEELQKIYEELKALGAIGTIFIVGYETDVPNYPGLWVKEGGKTNFIPWAMKQYIERYNQGVANKINKNIN